MNLYSFRYYTSFCFHNEMVENILILVLTLLIVNFVRSIIVPPRNFPKEIPTVPFYVSFLGTYTYMDQGQIYHKYLRAHLEKYGAVKIYFASRWNILVTKPEYLTEIFKNDEVYRKSGNHEKIPYSIFSQYTGENVISAHGENWRKYRKLITKGLQFYSSEETHSNVKKLIGLILNQIKIEGNSVLIGDLLQKFTLANICETMLGTKVDTLDSSSSDLHSKLKKIKKQIFNPFYMNFPIFDMFPIPSRLKTRKEVNEFREYFCDKIKAQQVANNANVKSAGFQLYEALNNMNLEEKEFQDNAIIIMVAGHENPQLLLTSLLYVLAKNSTLQEKVRKEALDITSRDNVYFRSVLYETLRMYPPLGQIINRKTTKETVLGKNIIIPKGTYVGYNNYGTGRDRNVWGDDADKFRPRRWGSTEEEVSKNYSIAKSTARLPSFHGRRRACLGEKFALFETEVVTFEILKKFEIRVDPTWKERITSAGPISPYELKLCFDPI